MRVEESDEVLSQAAYRSCVRARVCVTCVHALRARDLWVVVVAH